MHTFFWHDYESFGVNPRRDRPAQFAGIRTDANLEIIGDPVNIFCQPSPDFVPALQACLITGITPQHCLQHGMPEYQFAAQVEKELGAENTIGVGYNTIVFDDEISRFMFWRNLIPPYDREWKNGCARWDIMDMMRVVHAFRPDGINWPTRDDGAVSFRLEHLTAANGLAHEAAHDALSDVKATIGLARLVKQLHPQLFDYCLELRSKHGVQKHMRLGQPFIHVASTNPKANGHIGVMMPVAINPLNKSDFLCWNLASDPGVLQTMSVEEIQANLYKKSSERAEGEERLALNKVTINKSPMVFSHFKLLSDEVKSKWQIDMNIINANINKLTEIGNSIDLARKIGQVYARDYNETDDPDEALYGGFISDRDRRALDLLRMLSPEQMLTTDFTKFRPDDHNLAEVLFRYRARNFPQTLSDEERQRWSSHITRKIVDGACGHRTIEQLMADIDAMPADAPEKHKLIAAQLQQYVTALPRTDVPAPQTVDEAPALAPVPAA